VEFSERNLLEMLNNKELIYINQMGRSVIDYMVLLKRLLAESDKVGTCR